MFIIMIIDMKSSPSFKSDIQWVDQWPWAKCLDIFVENGN